MDSTLQIAILSDVHAYASKTTNPPSYVTPAAPADDHLNNPIAGLKKLVEDEKLQCNALLCAGDMCDKADPNAQTFMWDQLHQIGDCLKAEAVFAVPGNHDLDSRYAQSDHDPKAHLQSLDPLFPLTDENASNKFWARHFAFLEFPNWRLLLLNSAAFHGGGKKQAEEFERGRVSQKTIVAIESYMKGADPKPLNLLLCHHHPLKNDDIELKDYSQMVGGDLLLNLIGRGKYGDWIVIHGHKHYPRIWYGAGTGSAPVVFSAGSFSARLYPELGSKVRNQFYVVTFPLAKYDALCLGVCGTCQAWEWEYAAGWSRARSTSTIPYSSAFGTRRNPLAIARDVASTVQSLQSDAWVKWEEICEHVADAKYVLPEDFKRVQDLLANQYHVKCVRDSDGFPIEFRSQV